jgi:hypothetical protein
MKDLAVLAEAMFTGGIRHEELWEARHVAPLDTTWHCVSRHV